VAECRLIHLGNVSFYILSVLQGLKSLLLTSSCRDLIGKVTDVKIL